MACPVNGENPLSLCTKAGSSYQQPMHLKFLYEMGESSTILKSLLI